MISDSIKELYKPSEVFLKKHQPVVDRIKSFDFSGESDDRLKQMASEDISDEQAVALAGEAAFRTLGYRPFDSQLMAAVAMYKGNIAQMPTGEGKTLAAVFTAFLHVRQGRKVHVLTFNDYLAKRDREWMKPLYEFLGINVSFITEKTDIESRKKAYCADVMYATAKEAGFDYLRDFLAQTAEELTDNPFEAVIVDEADSIMIDEARIPLVIAGDMPYSSNVHLLAEEIYPKLIRNRDYEVDVQNNNASMTESGAQKVEEFIGIDNLYDDANAKYLEAVVDAVKAHALLKRDIDYIVRDGKVELVDEFTGRVADNRKYPEGLQAAVETKEHIKTQRQGMIMNTVSMRYFISLYKHVSGMTGTAITSAREFKEVYGLGCIAIEPHVPCIREDREDRLYKTSIDKFRAVTDEICKAHESGRPVLIGTQTVMDSERLASFLKIRGLEFNVLNAKNDESEAQIIAEAGKLGAITVSTNMAGRGVDIKLGGSDGTDAEKIKALGGLLVIGTNRHESVRIDNQLRGRAGRQGDPGESVFFISLQDDLMEHYSLRELLPEGYIDRLPPEGEIDDKRVIREAQRIQRIAEGRAYDEREQLSRYTDIIDVQRRKISERRKEILKGETNDSFVRDREPDYYYSVCNKFGHSAARDAERKITLYYINKGWAEYLDYTEYIKQGIHFVTLGGKNPCDEFNCTVAQAFEEMLSEIGDNVAEKFRNVKIDENGIDLEAEGIAGPSATWTYLVIESSAKFSRLPEIIKKLRKKPSFMDKIKGLFQ